MARSSELNATSRVYSLAPPTPTVNPEPVSIKYEASIVMRISSTAAPATITAVVSVEVM